MQITKSAFSSLLCTEDSQSFNLSIDPNIQDLAKEILDDGGMRRAGNIAGTLL